MADEIDELVLKIKTEVDSEQLKKVREDFKKLKENAEKNAVKLGIKTGQSGNGGSSAGAPVNFPSEIKEILTNSQKTLQEMLKILKDDNKRKTRRTDKEEEEGKGNTNPIPFVNEIKNQGIGGAAGGVIGGVVGAIAGGNVLAGAGIGSAIGSLVEGIFGDLKDKVEEVSKLFDAQVTENMHLRQLSQQTGMLIPALYKLQQQALLSGTSLEKLADSDQKLADELLGGISDQKAQLLMALNINPNDLLLKSGGDVSKLNQMIFAAIEKATKGMSAPFRASYESRFGYSPEDAAARRLLHRKDTVKKANDIYNEATHGGKTPILDSEEIFKQNLLFKGAEQQFIASIRAALSAGNVAQVLSTKLMDVKADVVNLIVGSITGFQNTAAENETNDKNASINNEEQTSRKSSDYSVVNGQLIYTPPNYRPKSPASQSGINRAASATGGG